MGHSWASKSPDPGASQTIIVIITSTALLPTHLRFTTLISDPLIHRFGDLPIPLHWSRVGRSELPAYWRGPSDA